jgi:hypothetical protein
MDKTAQATVAGAVLSTLFGLGFWGLLAWSHHRDMVAKHYQAGSVCDHEYARRHVYETAVVETSNSGGENSNTESSDGDPAIGDTETEIDADQRAEFQNIIDGLNAANASIRSRGEKALFCLPALSPLQEAQLYDTYWAATDVRAKQDAVCHRAYPEDVLAYMAKLYPCTA